MTSRALHTFAALSLALLASPAAADDAALTSRVDHATTLVASADPGATALGWYERAAEAQLVSSMTLAQLVARLKASGVWVLKAGDTMTGSLNVPSGARVGLSGANSNTAGIMLSESGGALAISANGTPRFTLNPGVAATFTDLVTTTSSFNASSFRLVDGNSNAGMFSGTALGLTANAFGARGAVADGATAVAAYVVSLNTLATSGAKLLSVVNNATEKLAVRLDGTLAMPGVATGALPACASGGCVQFDSTTGTLKVNNAGTGYYDAYHAPSGYALGLGTTQFVSTGTPTITSGFGTSPTISGNGSAAFEIHIGTGGVATSGVINATGAAGVSFYCYDRTTSNSNIIKVTGINGAYTLTNFNSTTGAAAAWVASDNVDCLAMGF